MSEISKNSPTESQESTSKNERSSTSLSQLVSDGLKPYPKIMDSLSKLLEKYKIILDSIGGIEIVAVDGNGISGTLTDISFRLKSDPTMRTWWLGVNKDFRKALVSIMVHAPSLTKLETRINEEMKKREFGTVKLILDISNGETKYVTTRVISYNQISQFSEKRDSLISEEFTYEFPASGDIPEEIIVEFVRKMEEKMKDVRTRGDKMKVEVV